MSEPVSRRNPVSALLLSLLWAAALGLPVLGAQGAVVFTSLYSFKSTTLGPYQPFPDGRYPIAALVQGSDGNFYGTTSQGGGTYTNQNWVFDTGTVFKISTNGTLITLYRFGSVQDTNGVPLDGACPQAALVQGSDGNFYGTTSKGGAYTNQDGSGYGTVFKISPSGALTTLYSFGSVQDTNGAPLDGANPQAALVRGSDGYLYGTTYCGGTTTYQSVTDTYGYGTVFKMSTNGVLATLYIFSGGNDGANPVAGLVQGTDGSFYGTTTGGIYGYGGTVFRLTILPEPQLTIIPSGPYMVLTWPTNFTGFTLQSTTNLGSSPGWSPVSAKPVVIGEQNAVINPISGTQQFYRLSR
jgi:uncharacterized repeat protein (TIGR03803 family)